MTNKPLAVIVKGNPKYLAHPEVKPMADKFYEHIKNLLSKKGFDVKFDAGEPYTLPDTAAVAWIGHSRGMDRLDHAPKNIKTIYLNTKDTYKVHGNKDRNGHDPAHYELNEDDMDSINNLTGNKYLEKIAADMKNFAHVRMQNLDNEGGSKVFTARNFKEVKDTNYSRRSGLNRKTDSIHNSPTGTYSGKNVKITKGKSGYRVEVNGNELDVNGRNSPTSYYNPNKKINAEEAFESIKGAGSKAGRTYNPSHLDEIHKGIKSVNRQHNIGQAIKFGKIGLIVGGVGAVGYGAKKLYDNK